MRTKPTISEGEPRESGPHGITLVMRNVGRTTAAVRDKRERDRALAGKARIRARRAAKAAC